jgi:chromosome segregation ATPase
MVSFLAGQRDHLESQVHYLRQQVDDLSAQLQTQELQLDFWRRRAVDLEQSATHATSEAERWKKLASDTADQLWEFGQSMGGEDFIAKAPMPDTKASVEKK